MVKVVAMVEVEGKELAVEKERKWRPWLRWKVKVVAGSGLDGSGVRIWRLKEHSLGINEGALRIKGEP